MSSQSKASADAIASVFFIDTASDILDHIETAAHVLRPSGIWANLGPLEWHHVPDATQIVPATKNEEKPANPGKNNKKGPFGSVELTFDESVEFIRKSGFAIEKYEKPRPFQDRQMRQSFPDEVVADEGDQVGESQYSGNANNMSWRTYRPVHWIARRLDD